MDGSRHDRARRIFERAREMRSDELARFLDEQCGDDRPLRVAVEKLLWAHQEARRLLGVDAADRSTPTTTNAPPPHHDPEIGATHGPYHILDRLGEGGFARVYLAEQRYPVRRRVALKMMKPGMDSEVLLARFEAERQALALLSHPNLATIFDAGRTESGRPYFVMEHVAGVPITVHCERHRLTIDARLRLFAAVCGAVQHAHQKGIIHRDLKPSNVLVAFGADGPVPKVIDFGVAKAIDRRLTEATLFTEQGQVVGTPAYMPPEQADPSVQDVDTRADVYALGVLLYELLTGALPFDRRVIREAGLEGIRRLISEVDPPKPSARLRTLSTSGGDEWARIERSLATDARHAIRRVRGDLDWITMKCLEKDRSRRYASASALAADVRRHLEDEPVSAGPPSAAYKARKFARRHRTLLATAAAVGFVALTGVIVATIFAVGWASERRDNDRRRAEEHLARAQRLAFQYPERARDAVERADELGVLRADVALARAYVDALHGEEERALATARRIVDEAPARGEAHAILAGLLRERDAGAASRHQRRARELLPPSKLHTLALGVTDDREALRIIDEALEAYPWNFDALWQRAVRRYRIYEYDAALEDAELLVKLRPDLGLAWSLRGSAVWGARGDTAAAERDFTRAIELEPDSSLGYFNRAFVRHEIGELEGALEDARRAAALDPDDADAEMLVAAIHIARKSWPDAIAAYERALAEGANPHHVARNRAQVLFQTREYEDAERDLSRALEGSFDDATHAAILHERGLARRFLGRLDEAVDDARRATELAPGVARYHFNLGWAHLLAGSYGAAEPAFEKTLEMDPDQRAWEIGPAYLAWWQGDDALALERMTALEEVPGYERIAVAIWEIETRLGRREAADERLRDAATRAAEADPFLEVLASAMTGGPTDGEAYLKDAGTDVDRLDLCVALGLRARAEGDDAVARSWFERAVRLGVGHRTSHDLAVHLLR